jgi:hypothetical protein
LEKRAEALGNDGALKSRGARPAVLITHESQAKTAGSKLDQHTKYVLSHSQAGIAAKKRTGSKAGPFLFLETDQA